MKVVLTILLKKVEDLEKIRSLKLTFEINLVSSMSSPLKSHLIYLTTSSSLVVIQTRGGGTKKKLQYIGDTVLNVL